MVTITMKLNLCGYVNYFDMDFGENYQAFLSKIRMVYSDSSENLPSYYRIKYYDDENDPCAISNDLELSEAISVTLKNEWSYLRIHLSYAHDTNEELNISNDQKSIKRKNAKRFKTRFFFKNHIYEKFFAFKVTNCDICKASTVALSSSTLKCISCNFVAHRKCLKNISEVCVPTNPPPENPSHTFNLYDNEEPTEENETYASFKLRRSNSHNYELHIQPDVEENASILNDFLLLKVIGRGSYSKVFLAKSKLNQNYYAIKAIRKSIQLEEDMRWIYTEKFVFTLARNCPFLVAMHCSFQNESRLFFVLEFVAGGDMMYFMQKIKKLSEDDTRFYASEILLGLDYLHEHNIIYRDLKLDNIMITTTGHVKLTDYGLCKKFVEDTSRRTNTFCGTPHYIAPEMLTGDDYGMSVDWWAYGVVLYELMVGKNPFDVTIESQNINANPEDYIYQHILETTIRYPRFITIKATNLLKSLLVKDPYKRIGVEPHSSVNDVKQCSFFKSVNWEKTLSLDVTPPKIHKLIQRKTTSSLKLLKYNNNNKSNSNSNSGRACNKDIKQMVMNFDNMFVDLSPKLTPEDDEIIDQLFQDQFICFDDN